MHVYRWLENSIARKQAGNKELKSLPEIKTKEEWTKKIHPGEYRKQTWGVVGGSLEHPHGY